MQRNAIKDGVNKVADAATKSFDPAPEALREELSSREGFIAADKLIKTTPLPFHRQRGFSVGPTEPVAPSGAAKDPEGSEG
jgi:hypothetical protein